MSVSVGVDLHKGQFTVCWLTDDGSKPTGERYLTSEGDFGRFERRLEELRCSGQSIRVAVESTGNTRYFKRRLEAIEIPVVVINPGKFKVVTESVKKTDRRDAAVIAEFLQKDMLPEARLCSTASEELRRLLRTRTVLVRSIVAIKNQVHGLLMSLGIEMAKGSLQSQKGRRRALTVLAEHGLASAAVEPLMETIDLVGSQVKVLEKLIEAKIAEDHVVELLRTIPGVGLISAATIRAYIDDISRFATFKQLAAYAGLAPWVQNSNNLERHGSITKRGPRELRTALVQVVLGMVRLKRRTSGYRIMESYEVMKRQKGTGKAIIAAARKLAKIIWYMLSRDEPFDELRMTDAKMRKTAMDMRAAVTTAA